MTPTLDVLGSDHATEAGPPQLRQVDAPEDYGPVGPPPEPVDPSNALAVAAEAAALAARRAERDPLMLCSKCPYGRGRLEVSGRAVRCGSCGWVAEGHALTAAWADYKPEAPRDPAPAPSLVPPPSASLGAWRVTAAGWERQSHTHFGFAFAKGELAIADLPDLSGAADEYVNAPMRAALAGFDASAEMTDLRRLIQQRADAVAQADAAAGESFSLAEQIEGALADGKDPSKLEGRRQKLIDQYPAFAARTSDFETGKRLQQRSGQDQLIVPRPWHPPPGQERTPRAC